MFATPAQAGVSETKKIKSPAALKAGEGAVQLSLRAQKQQTLTQSAYFVRLDDDGRDTDAVYKFERKAGVPLLGTNMIDPKPEIYRLPQGRYRLLGDARGCETVPRPGLMCIGGYGDGNISYYAPPAPMFEVVARGFTNAGDFILEYVGPDAPNVSDLFAKGIKSYPYAMRWLPLPEIVPAAFTHLPLAKPIPVPSHFLSKIRCTKRPASSTIQFPFRC